MSDETLSKAELTLIDSIIGSLTARSFQKLLWSKVEQIFKFAFKNTQIECGFTHVTPDQFALKYLEDRTFILSDKTQEKLRGNLRWELLEGIRNTESIDEIKRRLDGIFEGNTVDTERIARTEVLNAMNAGRYQANVQSGIAKYKMWQAAMNNPRTAADSKRLHGQIQKLNNSFIDPKTGESFLHPPNRPNCRCTCIFLRKLPLNVIMKDGEMYDGSEMVGKFEIDIESLNKTEKRIWVKPTVKRKGHYRKVKAAKKDGREKDEKLKSFTTNNLMIAGSEPQQVEVDDKWRIDIDPNHEYKGQCYDKAGKYVTECFYNIQKSELSEVRLVHGTTNFLSESPLVFGHAWVELSNGIVLDLTTQGFYDKNDYYEKLDAVKEVEYSAHEVLENMVENGTYGPWHKTKGMLR